MSDVLDIRGAAQYLGCSASALRNWKRQNRGPKYFRLGNKLLRYSRTELDAFIAANTHDQVQSANESSR